MTMGFRKYTDSRVQAIKTACGLIICCLGLISTSNYAAADCPESITVQSDILSSHPHWQSGSLPVITENQHLLDSIAFTDGPPSDGAVLHPASSNIVDNNSGKIFYDFSQNPTTKLWIVCVYRETRQILFQPLSANTCTVESTINLPYPIVRCQ